MAELFLPELCRPMWLENGGKCNLGDLVFPNFRQCDSFDDHQFAIKIECLYTAVGTYNCADALLYLRFGN